MRADGGWWHRSLAGATTRPSVAISTASSGLGLFQYPPIRSDERASGVRAAGADESLEGRSLLCLAIAAPRLPARLRSAHRGGLASVAFHVAVIAVLIAAANVSRSTNRPVLNPAHESIRLPRLVFLLQPGPGRGGGGGGNKQPGARRRVAITGSGASASRGTARREAVGIGHDDNARAHRGVAIAPLLARAWQRRGRGNRNGSGDRIGNRPRRWCRTRRRIRRRRLSRGQRRGRADASDAGETTVHGRRTATTDPGIRDARGCRQS